MAYQFIKPAKLKAKFRAFKTDENEIKTQNFCQAVLLCVWLLWVQFFFTLSGEVY